MNRASSATGWVRNPDGTLGWTWNPITGCLNNCSYCYARKLANGRLRGRYLANHNLAPTVGEGVTPLHTSQLIDSLDPFYPRFWPERVIEPIRGYHKADWLGVTPDAASEKGIFVCDMSDLFGIGIPQEWTQRVMDTIKKCPQDRFYLLTKQPQELPKWSPFPPNVWLGVSVTNQQMFDKAVHYLKVVDAKVKFLSFEPLLDHIIVDKT